MSLDLDQEVLIGKILGRLGQDIQSQARELGFVGAWIDSLNGNGGAVGYLQPIAFFDAPQVLDSAVTPIPGSSQAPLQVVASMPGSSKTIEYTDGIGQYVGVYVGMAGSEVLLCIIGGGETNEIDAPILPGTRVSLRSMDVAAITRGTLCCQFMG